MMHREDKEFLIWVHGDRNSGLGHIYEGISIAKYMLKLGLSQKKILFIISGEKLSEHIVKKKGFKTYYSSPLNVWNLVKKFSPFALIADTPAQIRDDLRSTLLKIKQLQVDRRITKIILIGDSGTNLPTDYPQLADFTINYGFSSKKIENRVIFHDEHNSMEFVGPSYIILDPIFFKMKKHTKENIRNILLAFGGSDPRNLTLKVLRKILLDKAMSKYLTISIVLGPGYRFRNQIEKYCARFLPKESRTKIYFNISVDQMCELMRQSDLLFTSPGRTMFEAMVMNLPLIAIIQNIFQAKSYDWLEFVFYEKDALINIENFLNEKFLQEIFLIEKQFVSKSKLGSGFKNAIEYILSNLGDL